MAYFNAQIGNSAMQKKICFNSIKAHFLSEQICRPEMVNGSWKKRSLELRGAKKSNPDAEM